MILTISWSSYTCSHSSKLFSFSTSSWFFQGSFLCVSCALTSSWISARFFSPHICRFGSYFQRDWKMDAHALWKDTCHWAGPPPTLAWNNFRKVLGALFPIIPDSNQITIFKLCPFSWCSSFATTMVVQALKAVVILRTISAFVMASLCGFWSALDRVNQMYFLKFFLLTETGGYPYSQ